MAALILPSRRVVQPQGPVEVDWANPLSQGLVAAVIDLGATKFDVVKRRNATVNGGPVVTGGSIIGYGSNYDRNFDHSYPLNVVTPAFASVFAVTLRTGSVAQFAGPLGVAESGETNRAFAFESGTGSFPASTSFLSAWDSSGSRFNLNPTLELTPLGIRQALGMSAGGGVLRGYADGIRVGSGTGPTTVQTAFNLFTGSGNGGRWSGFVPIACFWNRLLQDGEHQALSQNPWQLFRPIQRRIWVASGGGAATLLPGLLTNTSTLYAPTVTPGAVSVAPPLLSNAAVLYAPTVTPGAVTLQPGQLDASAAPFAPSVTVGAVSVAPPLLGAEAVLYAPSVSVGAVTLQPGLLSSPAVLYAPEVTAFAPGAQAVQPPLLSAPAAAFAPSITVGAVSVAPPLLSAEAAPYAPAVTTGVTVSAPLLSAEAVLYAPAVTAGEAEVLPPLLASQAILYAPSVSFGQVLSAPLLSSPAVPFAPTIFEGALSYDKAYLVAPPARLWRADGSPRNWRTS